MTTQLVLLDADDLMHPNTGEENYNESAYYNFYDPGRRLGGFARIGNRPNERHAEMTLCLYLPDGRVAFMFARPEIADNARFDAAASSSTACTTRSTASGFAIAPGARATGRRPRTTAGSP